VDRNVGPRRSSERAFAATPSGTKHGLRLAGRKHGRLALRPATPAMQNQRVREIHDIASLEQLLGENRPLQEVVVWGLDLRQHGAALAVRDLRGVVLLGCELASADLVRAVQSGALIFPSIDGLPYAPWSTRRSTPHTPHNRVDPRVS